MKEQYFNKFIIFLMVLLIAFAVFLQMTTEHSTEKLKDEEILKAEQYVSKIAKFIALRTEGNLEEALNQNPELRVQLNGALHAFLTQQYQYIFLLKKDDKGTYRFLLDGSENPDDYHSVFIPQSTLFDKVYNTGKMRIIQQEDKEVKNLWISLLYPMVINHKTEALLVLDFAKEYGEKLSHFNSPLMVVVHMMQIFLVLSILLLVFLAYRYFKTRQALIKDKLTATYTNYYLMELFNRANVNKYHAILIDLDAFKEVNARYGMVFGDEIIKSVAQVIMETLSKSTYVIRSGGTEFFALVPKEKRTIETVANSLFNILQQKVYYHNGQSLNVNVSMSAIDIPKDTFSIQDIQRVLDEKLLKVKSRGKNALGIVDTHILNHLHYGNIEYIKESLEQERLLCLYQPIFNTKTKEIIKYEALVRLIDKEDSEKLILPFYFMDTIKGTTQYIKMSKLVFANVFETLEKYPEVHLSVNVDLHDLENREMMQMICDTLASHQDIAHRLTFEILEEHEIKDYDKVQDIFTQLKRYGSKIAMDDFGSGFAGCGYLIRLDIDIIKIDGSLIQAVKTSPEKTKIIVKSIYEVAQKLECKVIAEFISDEEIYLIMLELGIPYVQGYYLGEPRPINEYLS